jgi:hypothetical protein
MGDRESMEIDEMLMLHRMPSPETYPDTAETRCPALLAEWLRLNPDAVATERDHEDWAEPAAIMVAMARRGEVTLLAPAGDQRTCGDRTAAPVARPGSPKGIMWGIFTDSDARELPVDVDLAWNARDKASLVQDYAHSPVFLARAGRAFHVCDMDRGQISAALQSIVDGGAERGFVKTRDKGIAYAFSLKDDGRTDMLGRPVSLFARMDGEDQDFSYSLMHRESDRACIYVQGAFAPTCEYRVVVVGDRVASGAGCIEAHTPAESEGSFFDDRMEVVRGSGDIVRMPELAERYAAFASEYAAAWAAVHGAECGYSLDLSVDADSGRIVPIEMNPLLNLGLYANDADRIVDAMLGRAVGMAIAA